MNSARGEEGVLNPGGRPRWFGGRNAAGRWGIVSRDPPQS
jgi:hypothetical protein